MASGRLIQRKISANKDMPILVRLVDGRHGVPHGAFAAMLFTWLIPHLDVEGRMNGDPNVVKGQVVPRMPWITPEHVEAYLNAMHELGLIVYYEAGGDHWISFPKFDKNQPKLQKSKEAKSQVPEPPQGANNNDSVSTPESLQSNSSATPSEEKRSRREVEEKRREETAADKPPPSSVKPSIDLGEADSKKQRRIVDEHLDESLRILSELNAARCRVRPSSHGIRPTYSSLGGIAARLAAGRTPEECLRVIAVGEAECARKADSFDWFDAVSPWRPDNFERRIAKDPASETSNPQTVRSTGHAKPAPHNTETKEYDL